ncbi:MAG: hypothetical protein M0027_02125 [Candidatus Dormibacteraeota bacterium]|nr:hypothetical protein [Candidatus Dormibacteraeota bacterium]
MAIETGSQTQPKIEVNGRSSWPVAPGRTRSRRARLLRRLEMALAGLILVAVVLGLVFLVRNVFIVPPSSFPAVVQPSTISDLQFATSGQLAAVDVYPGEHVRQGQVLATQDTTLLKLRLSYDQATLAADQATLSAIPGAVSAQHHGLSLEVTLAQQELNGAEAQLAAATTPQAQAAASAAVAAAQTKVALAENALLNGTTTSSSTALSAAQAAVARDEAAVAADQVALQQATLTAPSAGVIAAVGGTAGEIAGPSGVTAPAPVGSQVPTSAGFSLFPPAPQAPTVGGQPSSQPMIAFYPATFWEAVAVVPQSEIFSVHPGETARVTVNGRSGSIAGRVERVDSAPIYANGAASYDVVVRLDRSLGSGLLGMSANVSLGSQS